MNFELSLPLLWLVVFDLFSFGLFFKDKLWKSLGKKWVWLLFPSFLSLSILWSPNKIRGILTGIFTFLKMRNYISGSIINWWPIFGILSGVTLFVSGIYKYRKMSFGFVIPAIVIIILSAWFMLFSFKIITVPFKTVAIIGGPLLLVMLCVLLFVIFFIQQKGLFFVSSDEEPKQFEDDEIIPQ